MQSTLALSAERGLWLDTIRRDRNTSSAAFRLAHAIATYAKGDGLLMLTIHELADRVGVTPPTVSYGLDRLAGRRYIELLRGPAGNPVTIRIKR